jgi:hypothetical protein
MSKMSPIKHPGFVLLRSRLLQTELGISTPPISTNFKNTHKQIHKQYQTYDPFINQKGFEYTGTLRASYPEIPVPMRKIPPHIVLPDHAITGIPATERKERFSRGIDILKPKEIEAMRKVCRVVSSERPY